MIRRILWLVLALVSAGVLVALAVANNHTVPLVLDPFRPDAPALALTLPFYVHLLVAMIVGVLLGGAATWLSQGRWRRMARVRGSEAKRWHSEADRLARERDAEVAGAKKARQLAPAGGRNAA